MQQPHLIYVADPMCSWCWGFSPVVQAIAQRYGDAMPIRVLLGGLRPWTREPMDQTDRADVRSHWEHVHEASGQPFDFGFFDREYFVYDTEPACRAIVVLRRHGMPAALAALQRIQHAFYANNQNVTLVDNLAAIAGELGFDETEFREAFASDQARDATRADFALAQSAGIRGFPTLLAGHGDGQYDLITQGFQPAERILGLLDSWLARNRPDPATHAGKSCVLH